MSVFQDQYNRYDQPSLELYNEMTLS
jgi:hypothetical protein